MSSSKTFSGLLIKDHTPLVSGVADDGLPAVLNLYRTLLSSSVLLTENSGQAEGEAFKVEYLLSLLRDNRFDSIGIFVLVTRTDSYLRAQIHAVNIVKSICQLNRF